MERSVVSLVAEVVMLPLTALVYGMELLVRAMQGMQSAAQQSVDVATGAPPGSPPRTDDVEAGFRMEGQVTTRGQTGPESRHVEKETAAMDQSSCQDSRRDRDLRDDMLKLVRYKILFVRREYEVAFPEQEDLVEDNMDPTAFAAWKVAEFIQSLAKQKTEVPHRWDRRNYPPQDNPKDRDQYLHPNGTLKALPEEDKKYLRVYYEVLERYTREKFKHEEQQIRVLEQIRDKI